MSDEFELAGGREIVLKTGQSIVTWEPIRGMYCYHQDTDHQTALVEEPADDAVLWPKDFKHKTGFFDAREPPYLLYEQSGGNEFFGPRKHHIVRDGTTICRVNVRIPAPDSDSLTPLSEIDEEAWDRIGVEDGRSRLCGNCRNKAREQGLLENSVIW